MANTTASGAEKQTAQGSSNHDGSAHNKQKTQLWSVHCSQSAHAYGTRVLQESMALHGALSRTPPRSPGRLPSLHVQQRGPHSTQDRSVLSVSIIVRIGSNPHGWPYGKFHLQQVSRGLQKRRSLMATGRGGMCGAAHPPRHKHGAVTAPSPAHRHRKRYGRYIDAMNKHLYMRLRHERRTPECRYRGLEGSTSCIPVIMTACLRRGKVPSSSGGAT